MQTVQKEVFESKEIPDYSTTKDSLWFLELKALPAWLTTLDSRDVIDELWDSLIWFQRDAFNKIGKLMLLEFFRHNPDLDIISNN